MTKVSIIVVPDFLSQEEVSGNYTDKQILNKKVIRLETEGWKRGQEFLQNRELVQRMYKWFK